MKTKDPLLSSHASAGATLPAPSVPLADANKGGFGPQMTPNLKSRVIVVIPPDANTGTGDTFFLYWGDPDRAVDTYTVPSGSPTFAMSVPLLDVVRKGAGFVEVWYERKSPAAGEAPIPSSRTTVLVKTTIPGGTDPDPANTPLVNENLTLPSISPEGIIDRSRAFSGVQVTVNPWIDMEVGDQLTVQWGTHSIVRNALVSTDIGSPVTVTIDSDTILSEGDNDKLPVYYFIEDVVGQWSYFSPQAHVEVEASADVFEEPFIDGAKNGILDRDALGIHDAIVEITVKDTTIAVGDKIHLMFNGHTADGWLVTEESDATVEVLRYTIPMRISNAVLANVAPGNASLRYEVIGSDKKSKGLSSRTYVTIIGTAVQLPAPKITEAKDGTLDPAMTELGAHVMIEAALAWRVGDKISLVWNGTMADDRPDLVIQEHEIQSGEERESLIFTIPSENVERIAGGKVDVYYLVKRDNNSRESDHTALTIMNINRLARPEVDGVVDGQLYSGSVPNGAKITIPVWSSMAIGDRVDWTWTGQAAAGSTQGSETLASPGEVGKPVVVNVPRVVIEANADNEDYVTVRYTLTRAGTTTLEYSQTTSFNVIKSLEEKLPAPSVDDAIGDILDPMTLPDTGTIVRVKPYNGRQIGDWVTVYFGRGTGLGEVFEPFNLTKNMLNEDITMQVPKDKVRVHLNSQVAVEYTVDEETRNIKSDVLVLNVQEQAKWPAPTVVEANGHYFDPAKIPSGATVRIPQNMNMQFQDEIHLHWGSENGDIPPYTDFTRIKDPRDYTFRVLSNELAKWNNRVVPISYTIKRGTEIFPSDTFLLGIGVADPTDFPAPFILEAIDGVLDLDRLTTGSATAVIPADADLSLDDTVVLIWGGGKENGGNSWDIDISANMVGYEIPYPIPLEDIRKFLGRTATLYYDVNPKSLERRRSRTLTVSVEQKGEALPPPSMPDVKNGILDPRSISGSGTTVVVSRSPGMLQGDTIKLHWDSSSSPHRNKEELVPSLNDIHIEVPREWVSSVDGESVQVWYEWYRGRALQGISSHLKIDVKSSKLPLPIIVEARNATLYTGDVGDFAHVRIPNSGEFRSGDDIELHWSGVSDEGSGNFRHTILLNEADKDIVFDVPKRLVDANNGHSVTLDYTVTYFKGGVQEKSAAAQYDIRTAIGSGALLVMGARSPGGTHRASGGVQYMRALNKDSKQDLIAEWRYQDETTWTIGTSFKDTRPWVLLHVRSETDEVVINAANIFGSGADSQLAGVSALTAMYQSASNGFSVISWGNTQYGGNTGSTIMTNEDIVEVSSTQSAFCARRSNGLVSVWGNTSEGGLITGSIKNVQRVFGNGSAFAAICDSGTEQTLAAWGVSTSGGSLTEQARQLKDVIKVAASGKAFCALRSNKAVVAWGDVGSSTVPQEIAQSNNILDVRGNFTAFCALTEHGHVVAWGADADGGKVPDEIARRNDILELASASARAFAVRTNGHGVLAWGSSNHGGTIPDEIKRLELADIEEVTATWGAFCARRATGRVITWGDSQRGGTFPDELALQNKDIVQVVGTSSAFAALRSDGSVIAWPSTVPAGNTASVAKELVNIRAIYANSEVFVAVKNSGGVVTWGVAAGGGSTTEAISTLLNQKLHYEAKTSNLSETTNQNKTVITNNN